jgi:2-polyprenyl-6-methoxyphenol hydroxylase-like FAD-dependent oxidoreductase
MTRAPRIAIVGGGVGGLAAVLALERWGAEIVVCEQSPAPISVGSTPRGEKKRKGNHRDQSQDLRGTRN